MITDEQISAAAYLIATERDHHHPETPWQRPGVESAIRDLAAKGADMPAIITAGYSAAADPAARTPMAIGFDRHARSKPTPIPEPAGPRCTGCGFTEAKHNRVAGRVYPAHPFATDPHPFHGTVGGDGDD